MKPALPAATLPPLPTNDACIANTLCLWLPLQIGTYFNAFSTTRMTEQEALIAVMGPSGSGKTAFVNLASGSNFEVGSKLTSCTAEIAESEPFSVALEEGTRNVILIDTPGFDDTTKSDLDILKLIAHHLTTKYRNYRTLAGIIYMQRISDARLGGTFTRNIRMFQKLCGHKSMVNVVIATTFWSKVAEQEGESRMQELRADLFFGRALNQGAVMMRQKDKQTTFAIIARILAKGEEALRIQKEMVDHKKPLPRTSASQELYCLLKDQLSVFKEETKGLAEELKEAQARGNVEAVQDAEAGINDVENNMKRIAKDLKHTKTVAAHLSSLFKRNKGPS